MFLHQIYTICCLLSWEVAKNLGGKIRFKEVEKKYWEILNFAEFMLSFVSILRRILRSWNFHSLFFGNLSTSDFAKLTGQLVLHTITSNFSILPWNDDDDDGVFLFQEKHETQELYLVTSPRHAWGWKNWVIVHRSTRSSKCVSSNFVPVSVYAASGCLHCGYLLPNCELWFCTYVSIY